VNGMALLSDGYFNNIMTMLNVILAEEYPNECTSDVKTRVSMLYSLEPLLVSWHWVKYAITSGEKLPSSSRRR
jgi:hypothetical protein